MTDWRLERDQKTKKTKGKKTEKDQGKKKKKVEQR